MLVSFWIDRPAEDAAPSSVAVCDERSLAVVREAALFYPIRFEGPATARAALERGEVDFALLPSGQTQGLRIVAVPHPASGETFILVGPSAVAS